MKVKGVDCKNVGIDVFRFSSKVYVIRGNLIVETLDYSELSCIF